MPSLRTRLMSAAAAVASAAGLLTAIAPSADAVVSNSVASAVAKSALTHVGQRYREGAAGPRVFDCSGLAYYLYGQRHVRLPRTADQQFHGTRPVARSAARPGDLVFYHSTRNPRSYVYHVAVYEGRGIQVAAATPRAGVVRERIWSSSVTFGRV